MTKVEEYLYKRLDYLSEEKVVLITKINKVTIEIEEVDGKIEEMSNDMDTAFEIFSPKPKKNDFNRNEIERLSKRKDELIALRNEFVQQCMVVEEDIVEIKESLGEEFDEDLLYDINEFKEEMVYGHKILDKQEIEKQEIAAKINSITISPINNMIHKCEICDKIINVDPVRARMEMELISKELRDMSENLKNIIYELKPADYKDVNICVALERMVNLVKLNTEMIINLNITENKFKLTPVIEMTLIRIIQEAVDNSIKYSEGKNININLIYDEEFVKVEIEDDGKGINFEKTIDDSGNINTLGLSMMRERTYLLGGDIKIITDGKGTIITVTVPLNN